MSRDRFANYDNSIETTFTLKDSTLKNFVSETAMTFPNKGILSGADDYDSAYFSATPSSDKHATVSTTAESAVSKPSLPKDDDGERYRIQRSAVLSGKSQTMTSEGEFDVEAEVKQFPIRLDEIDTRIRYYEYELKKEQKIVEAYGKLERVGSLRNISDDVSSSQPGLNRSFTATFERNSKEGSANGSILSMSRAATKPGAEPERKPKGILASLGAESAQSLKKSLSSSALAEKLLFRGGSSNNRSGQHVSSQSEEQLALLRSSKSRIECLNEVLKLINLHRESIIMPSDFPELKPEGSRNTYTRWIDEVNKDIISHTIRKPLDDDYELMSQLRKGRCSETHYGRQKPTGNVSVIVKKFYLKTINDITEHLRIIEQQKKCFANPLILKTFGHYFSRNPLIITSISEYCECGSLGDYLQDHTLQEDQIAAVSAQVLKALVFLHSSEIVHKDVRANNILIQRRGRLKLSEVNPPSLVFSTERKYDTEKTHLKLRYCTNTYWAAPEGFARGGVYSLKADIWSFGITIIEIAETYPPLAIDTGPIDAVNKILEGPAPQLRHSSIWSNQMKDFITKCLNKDPKKRTSSSELQNHPFIIAGQGCESLFLVSETMACRNGVVGMK